VAQKTQKTQRYLKDLEALKDLKARGNLSSKFKIFYDICTFVNYTKFGNLGSCDLGSLPLLLKKVF
jgi:hypothetical protein